MFSHLPEFNVSQDNLELAAMIGSRICHDLISPIGAIINGLEMVQLSGAPPSKEMDLIGDSATNASGRIRFFRLAYGISDSDHAIAASEIRDILGAMGRNGRITHDWQVEGDIQRREARIAFLAMQCLETVLPRGGRITINRGHDSTWRMEAKGRDARASDDLADMLIDGPDAGVLCAANVQFAILAEVLHATGRVPVLGGAGADGTVTLRL